MNASDFLPTEFNVATWFVDRPVAEGKGAAPAFHCEGRVLTYADVQELADRTGNALRELGVEMEHRVLMICLDTPEFLATFWGAIKIGAVPVPVNTLLRAADFRYVLDDSRARVAVVSAALLAEAGPALQGAPSLRHVLVAGAGASGSHLSFEDRVARASRALEAAPTSRDDVAFWLYSSGSTGRPKGAVHLHHDMVIAAETYAKQVLGFRPTDKVYSAAKLFFAYGLGNAGYFPMSVGAQSVLYPHRPTPDTVFELLARHRPTLFFGVPTLYAAMLAAKGTERFDLSSLRLCVSAGEALPADLYRRWRERFGVEIVDGIGTTESGHIFLSNRPGAVRPGSSGLPVPGYECAIVDDDGRPVPVGEIGSLRVRGDSTMAYYWNKHDKTKETLFGPWIQTGDKYHQDADGYFWYDGRGDDMLKVGGIWVSPVEVEATLIQHPAVLEAAVVGQEDDDKLVKPRAYVVLKDPAGASEALASELRAFVKEKIAPYKYPRWIDFVPELPKTATGKIQRFKLRQGASTP
jgi:benzoate-CoA ligase family protein